MDWVLDDFGKWGMLQSDPRELLDKYRIDFCLISREAPMARVLPLMGGWKAAYSDTQAIIFVRTQSRLNPEGTGSQ
jgi:hypothetical protein